MKFFTFSYLSCSKKGKISLSHQPLLRDSQSEKSDYIIKRFIGKKKEPILTVFTSKKGKRPYSPLKKKHTHTQVMVEQFIK